MYKHVHVTCTCTCTCACACAYVTGNGSGPALPLTGRPSVMWCGSASVVVCPAFRLFCRVAVRVSCSLQSYHPSQITGTRLYRHSLDHLAHAAKFSSRCSVVVLLTGCSPRVSLHTLATARSRHVLSRPYAYMRVLRPPRSQRASPTHPTAAAAAAARAAAAACSLLFAARRAGPTRSS